MSTAPDRFGKSIIVCIDGTTNAPEIGPKTPTPTNVLLFTRALAPRDAQGAPQIVNYIWGVGTDESAGRVGRLAASATGRGLSVIVQKAYEFLVNNYEPWDYVYILGFSRGAAAARSLSGLTELFGILPKTVIDAFPDAWGYYNQPPPDRDLNKLASRSRLLADIAAQGEQRREAHERECMDDDGRSPEPRSNEHLEPERWEPTEGAFRSDDDSRYVPLPLHFVGVWDTVLTAFDEGFHEQRLAWNVGTACHALALHEVREKFSPVLWERKCRHQIVVQTWFAGAHSDVGGGNGNDGLSSTPLAWMIERAQTHPYVPPGHALQFNQRYLGRILRPDVCADVSNPEGDFLWMKWKTRPIGGAQASWKGQPLQFRSRTVDERQKRGAPPYVAGFGSEDLKKAADTLGRSLPPE